MKVYIRNSYNVYKYLLLLCTIGNYGVALWTLFDNAIITNTVPISEFPELGSTLLTLMAINHADYLAMKGKTK